MTVYYAKLLTTPIRNTLNGQNFLRAAVGFILLAWFVFSGLISALDLSNSFSLGALLWYSCSTVLLFGITAYTVCRLLELASFKMGPFNWSVQGRGGTPPETPPLEGSPCPVPVRPAPHLVRRAAEPLPKDIRKTVNAIAQQPEP